jgi:hypothetical protein
MSKKRDLNKSKAHQAKLQQLQLQAEERAAFKMKLQEGTVVDFPYSSMYIQDSQLYFLMKNIKFWIKDDSIKLEYQKVRRAFINRKKPPFSCYVIRERIDYFDQNKLLKLLSEEYARLIPDEGDGKVLESGRVPQLPANCVRSNDWSNIEFLNGEIVMLHDGRHFLFKWKDSLKAFQTVHACLRHVKLPYGFVLDNGKITELFIEDRVFRFIDIIITSNLDYHKFINLFKNQDSKTTFSGQTRDLIAFYPYDKQRYFSKLLSVCQKDIYRIKESRAFNSHNTITTEYSFLFEIAKNGKIYWVWEMLDSRSATYIFSSTRSQNSKVVCSELLHFLVSPVRNKRQQLTSNGAKDLFGISKVTRINHSLSKANYDNWWDKLKRILV